jgi:hypothetical protein
MVDPINSRLNILIHTDADTGNKEVIIDPINVDN